MKAFIWTTNVLPQHSDGVALAVADTVEQARDIILNEHAAESLRKIKEYANNPNHTRISFWEDYFTDNHAKLAEALLLDHEEKELPFAFYMSGSS